jgi:two-component system cell cycle response regulator
MIAERIRTMLQASLSSTISTPITISIGVAQYQSEEALETFVSRADQALYQAKEQGRNRVVRWSQIHPTPR